IRHWKRRDEVPRSSSDSGGSRKLTRRLKDLGPLGAALVGVLKQPWAITTAAAVVVVHHHEPLVVALIAFACFMILSTASVAAMYLYYTWHPGRASVYLAKLRDQATSSGPIVFAVAGTVVGAFLVLDGLIGLNAS